MPIVFAAPAASPVLSPSTNPRAMKWTGFDGSVWDLGKTSGPLTLARGVRGLHMPEFDVFQSSTPLVHGADLTGYTIPPRRVVWPLNVFSHSIDEWLATYSGLFDSMHPIELGVWTVGEGDQARTLPLTYMPGGEDLAFANDPFVTGWALIGVEMLAPRPLWRGKPIRKTFYAEEAVDFIPEEPGDEYHPTPTATFATAEMTNPGNEPAYLEWIANGPHPAGTLSLGVSGAAVDVPFDVDEGAELRIDTDPAGQFATLDGVDVTQELGFQTFAPVPSRGTSSLAIASAGDGSVTAQLVPLHWRAF